MTDRSDDVLAARLLPGGGTVKAPGVYAASVITWVVATGTALLTLLLCVAGLVVASPIFKTFEPGTGKPRWILLEGTAIVWALAGAADVAAILVVRRSRAARWVLAGLSSVAGLLGLAGLYYVPDRPWMTGTR